MVPADLPVSQCNDANMQNTLAELSINFMVSAATRAVRSGGFVPAFRVIYKDGAHMVTVGGVLPSNRSKARKTSDIVKDDEWRCMPGEPVASPLLTIREAMALQSKLPRRKGKELTRDLVQNLGFDLEEDQIKAYERYYKEYPAFAQIVT